MGECVVCRQQITNPLSPERLAEQMSSWLAEVRPELMKGLTDKTEEILPLECGDVNCIVTGRPVSLCTYCYTEHIFNWLISIRAGTDLVAEFITYFHFDGARQGYWRVADELGVTH